MSDLSDKSDFIGVPQMQKKRGRQNIGFCNSPISPFAKVPSANLRLKLLFQDGVGFGESFTVIEMIDKGVNAENGKNPGQQKDEPFAVFYIKGEFRTLLVGHLNDAHGTSTFDLDAPRGFGDVKEVDETPLRGDNAGAAVVAAAEHGESCFDRTEQGVGKMLFRFTAPGIPGVV